MDVWKSFLQSVKPMVGDFKSILDSVIPSINDFEGISLVPEAFNEGHQPFLGIVKPSINEIDNLCNLAVFYVDSSRKIEPFMIFSTRNTFV